VPLWKPWATKGSPRSNRTGCRAAARRLTICEIASRLLSAPASAPPHAPRDRDDGGSDLGGSLGLVRADQPASVPRRELSLPSEPPPEREPARSERSQVTGDMGRTQCDDALTVGLLGTSFMGKAHSRGWTLLATLEDDPAAVPILQAVCGRDPGRTAAIARRFGWQRVHTRWQDLVESQDVVVFDNAAPNHLHAAPTIAALRSGMHVICEKPLGRTSAEALEMLREARAAGVAHMCAFNYRFFPAIRIARQLLEGGELGDIHHFRSRFLLGTGALEGVGETPWRLQAEYAGSGVVGDLLAHHVDLMRFLVDEPTAVTATTRTWASERSGVTVEVEDAVACTIELSGGAIGTMEATRVAPGHILTSVIEVDGSRGSLSFDVARPNELSRSTARGTTTISATESDDPFMGFWWPRGHGIGWGDSFVHELRHFLGACAGAWAVEPHGATFEDGYRCAVVCDAILDAARQRRRVAIQNGAEPS
jgi:predicted dehydrogenase